MEYWNNQFYMLGLISQTFNILGTETVMIMNTVIIL